MGMYRQCIIKSFKHDGRLHRTWLENWRVADESLLAEHAAENMFVLVNWQTPIQEADGKQWTSRIPAVSFFIPDHWFNVVALLEDSGIRYYCNIASPPYFADGVLTYIDYDLDIIVLPEGSVHIVDQDEYELHRAMYHYSRLVEDKVAGGLAGLKRRIARAEAPFRDRDVRKYYEAWRDSGNEVRHGP